VTSEALKVLNPYRQLPTITQVSPWFGHGFHTGFVCSSFRDALRPNSIPTLAGFLSFLVLLLDFLAGSGFDDGEGGSLNILSNLKHGDLLFTCFILEIDG
jgi:hypothetical protein